MVGMNQNSYMDHENERMDLILFSDSRKKKKNSIQLRENLFFYDQEFIH